MRVRSAAGTRVRSEPAIGATAIPAPPPGVRGEEGGSGVHPRKGALGGWREQDERAKACVRFLMGKPHRLPFPSVTYAAGWFLPVTPFGYNLRVSLCSLLMAIIKGDADQCLKRNQTLVTPRLSYNRCFLKLCSHILT